MATRKKERLVNGNVSSSKITDFYTSPTKVKEQVLELDDQQTVEESELNVSLQSSSVLLTPDASPCKDKELSSNCNQNNNNTCEFLTDKLLAQISPRHSLHVACESTSLPEHVKDIANSFSPKKSTILTEPSHHSKQILLDDIKLENNCTSPTNAVHNPETSNPKKRRGRKGRVKAVSASATVKSEAQPKPKAVRKKKIEPDAGNNKTITDFFPVRRSGRKCQSELQKVRMIEYEDKVLSLCEDGLEVVEMNGKGRGVIATKIFKKGAFVVEYTGDLINLAESKDREEFYGMNSQYGCYMYYFSLKNKQYCIDATGESGKLGRLLNHSRYGNCSTKLIEIKDRPYLILTASRDIVKGEELLYDYGDRSKESLEAHPWLKL